MKPCIVFQELYRIQLQMYQQVGKAFEQLSNVLLNLLKHRWLHELRLWWCILLAQLVPYPSRVCKLDELLHFSSNKWLNLIMLLALYQEVEAIPIRHFHHSWIQQGYVWVNHYPKIHLLLLSVAKEL